MYTIDNVTTGPTFTPATTIENVVLGAGGYCYIQNFDVWCQIQMMRGGQGDPEWLIPMHIPQGGATFKGPITGCRFWTYSSPAIVSAAIFLVDIAQLTLGSYGKS